MTLRPQTLHKGPKRLVIRIHKPILPHTLQLALPSLGVEFLQDLIPRTGALVQSRGLVPPSTTYVLGRVLLERHRIALVVFASVVRGVLYTAHFPTADLPFGVVHRVPFADVFVEDVVEAVGEGAAVVQDWPELPVARNVVSWNFKYSYEVYNSPGISYLVFSLLDELL